MKPLWLAKLEEFLIAFLLAAMTLVTFAQVVARYVFNYSFVWALELTTFLFAGLIFIGISYGVRILPRKVAHRVAIVATILCLIYTALVLRGSYNYVDKMYEIGIMAQNLPVRQWIPRLVLPIGYALLFVFMFMGMPVAIALVVYGAVTETSVGALFMAGVVHGLLLGLLLMIAIYIIARIRDLPRQPRASLRETLTAGRDSFWGLMLIVIILGGIYGGIFTPTEAAAVSAVYAFIVAVFVYRDIGMRQVPGVLIDAARVTVMLMFIIVNALLFAHVLTTERIPQVIAEQIIAWQMAPWEFLVVVNALLLLAGAFMEPTGIILILAPILFPIAMELGIDPVHLGIIIVVNLEIGMVTPPIGLNLFVTSGITNMSIGAVVRAAVPWLSVLLAFLILVTYVPWISLWLPGLAGS